MKYTLPALAALVLCACANAPEQAPATPAAATAAPKPVPMMGHAGDVMAYVRAFDLNGDDVLTRQEFEEQRRRRFAQADANHDGLISLPEYVKEFEARLNERLQEAQKQADGMTELRFKSLAGEGNSHITRERFDQSGERAYAAYAAGKLPESAPAAPGDILRMPTNHTRAGMMALYDRNNDGRLPREEYDAARQDQFKQSDVNRDGRLSRDEYAAEFQQRLDKRLNEIRARQLRQAGVRFGVLDTNKDDRIDEQEYLASGLKRSFEGMDRNHDGRVDAADHALPDPRAAKDKDGKPADKHDKKAPAHKH